MRGVNFSINTYEILPRFFNLLYVLLDFFLYEIFRVTPRFYASKNSLPLKGSSRLNRIIPIKSWIMQKWCRLVKLLKTYKKLGKDKLYFLLLFIFALIFILSEVLWDIRKRPPFCTQQHWCSISVEVQENLSSA